MRQPLPLDQCVRLLWTAYTQSASDQNVALTRDQVLDIIDALEAALKD